MLKFIVLLWLSILSSYVVSEDNTDIIKLLRQEYLSEKKQNDIIKALEKKEKLNQVYIRAYQTEQECLKLGIDCKTGKKLVKKEQAQPDQTIDEQISEIQDTQRLIDAKLALVKKQENCIFKGLKDCGSLKYTTVKNKKFITKKEISKGDLPALPILLGFLNHQALFRVSGHIQSYVTGDTIENQYKVKSITIGVLVIVTHPDNPNNIKITLN